MTAEERLDRIEHYTAGLIEERRKDREEYKMLWRDTNAALQQTNAAVQRLSDETRQGIEELRKETQAADRILGKRIDELRQGLDDLRGRVDSLVSAIGAGLREKQ